MQRGSDIMKLILPIWKSALSHVNRLGHFIGACAVRTYIGNPCGDFKKRPWLRSLVVLGCSGLSLGCHPWCSMTKTPIYQLKTFLMIILIFIIAISHQSSPIFGNVYIAKSSGKKLLMLLKLQWLLVWWKDAPHFCISLWTNVTFSEVTRKCTIGHWTNNSRVCRVVVSNSLTCLWHTWKINVMWTTVSVISSITYKESRFYSFIFLTTYNNHYVCLL